MTAALRAAARTRAADRCEYCQRRQSDSPLFPLHLEHVIPRKHGGTDHLDNLGLACGECKLRKGSNLTGIDAMTNQVTALFNPRRQSWAEHFGWDGVRIVGRTAAGRTTVRVLDLNSTERLRVRLATG